MLPGKPNADESQAVQIHMSLALGMFISRLCEEKVRYECRHLAGVQITFASSNARYSDYAEQHVQPSALHSSQAVLQDAFRLNDFLGPPFSSVFHYFAAM